MYLLNAITFVGLILHAASGHSEPKLPAAELTRRAELSKRCSHAVVDFNHRRIVKRFTSELQESQPNTTYRITTDAPYYPTVHNGTCILSPESTNGPFDWPAAHMLRQDITENEPGVALWLDIGVIDMATCEPLEGVLVNIWQTNATGYYSSFTGFSPNIDFQPQLDLKNITNYGPGVDIHTDETTFLRGMWPTDSNGMTEIKTIFPGFYITRSIHIHLQAFTNWKIHANGTLTSGKLIHTGQLYFEESLAQQVMSLPPYSTHVEVDRTANEKDPVFGYDTAGGFNPILSIVPKDGISVEKGMVGYITLGLDTEKAKDPNESWTGPA